MADGTVQISLLSSIMFYLYHLVIARRNLSTVAHLQPA